MARGAKFPKEVQAAVGLGVLAIHVGKAINHQKTCPQCVNRDLITIMLDVWHLWG